MPLEPQSGEISEAKEPFECFVKLQASSQPVYVVRFNKAGSHIFTAGQDRSIHLWNPFRDVDSDVTVSQNGALTTSSPHYVTSLHGSHGYDILDLAISTDGGRIVSVGGDRDAFVWDTASGKQVLKLRGHSGRINSVCYVDSDVCSVAATASSDYSVHIWDTRVKGRNVMQILGGFTDAVTCVRMADSGPAVLCSSLDSSLQSFDLRTGGKTEDFIGASGTWFDLSSDDECVLVQTLPSAPPRADRALSARGSPMRMLDRRDGSLLMSFTGPISDSYKLECTFISNGALAVSGSSNASLHIFSVEGTTGSDGHPARPVGGTVIDCAHTPSPHIPERSSTDGLASSSSIGLDPRAVAQPGLVCHTSVIGTVAALGPDPITGVPRKCFASGSFDGSICLWA